MTDELRALTRDQSFLAAIVARLDQQNAVLADIRNRLPEAPSQPVTDQAGANGGPQEVELTEPALPAQGGTVPLAEPVQPMKRPPAKKPAAKRTTTARTAATKRS